MCTIPGLVTPSHPSDGCTPLSLWGFGLYQFSPEGFATLSETEQNAIREELLASSPFTVKLVNDTIQFVRLIGALFILWGSRMLLKSGRANIWRLLDEFSSRMHLAVDRLVQKSLVLTMLPQNQVTKLQAETRAVGLKPGSDGTAIKRLARMDTSAIKDKAPV